MVRLCALGIVGAALTGVVAHSLMAESQLHVIAVADESAAEQRRYEEARLEVARLESPAAVMRRAAVLGLVPAGGARTVAVPATRTNATVGAGDVPGATQAWQAIKAIIGATR
ncbi:MAG: hypothetical protein JJE46_15170 [Acidimicrobiia bacterium]|nr:hypothetical protein [Acidimicrobiia bacterium]